MKSLPHLLELNSKPVVLVLDVVLFALVLVVAKVVALPESEIGADAIQSSLALLVEPIEEVLLVVVEISPLRERGNGLAFPAATMRKTRGSGLTRVTSFCSSGRGVLAVFRCCRGRCRIYTSRRGP